MIIDKSRLAVLVSLFLFFFYTLDVGYLQDGWLSLYFSFSLLPSKQRPRIIDTFLSLLACVILIFTLSFFTFTFTFILFIFISISPLCLFRALSLSLFFF